MRGRLSCFSEKMVPDSKREIRLGEEIRIRKRPRSILVNFLRINFSSIGSNRFFEPIFPEDNGKRLSTGENNTVFPLMPKSFPVSTRLSQADVDFLSGVSVAGASTPSDKIRAFIREARARRDAGRSYEGFRSFLEEIVSSTDGKKTCGSSFRNTNSEFIEYLARWLPETVAYLVSATRPEQDEDARRETEEELADRVFALVLFTLRLGVTSESPCLNPLLVSSRIKPVLEIVEIIRATAAADGHVAAPILEHAHAGL